MLAGLRGPRLVAALATAALLAVAGAAAAHATDKLDGVWTAVAAERDGQPADELKGHRLTFAGQTFVVEHEGKTLYRGTFTTSPRRKPAQIDFIHAEGDLRGKRWLGVYTLEADTLRIADNAPDVGKPRPTRLAAGAGSGHVLLTFKRTPR